MQVANKPNDWNWVEPSILTKVIIVRLNTKIDEITTKKRNSALLSSLAFRQ